MTHRCPGEDCAVCAYLEKLKIGAPVTPLLIAKSTHRGLCQCDWCLNGLGVIDKIAGPEGTLKTHPLAPRQ